MIGQKHREIAAERKYILRQERLANNDLRAGDAKGAARHFANAKNDSRDIAKDQAKIADKHNDIERHRDHAQKQRDRLVDVHKDIASDRDRLAGQRKTLARIATVRTRIVSASRSSGRTRRPSARTSHRIARSCARRGRGRSAR